MVFIPLLLFTGIAAFAVLWVIFVFTKRLEAQRDNDRRTLSLVEKALDHGAIDAATKAMLVRAVTDRQRSSIAPLFAIGWLGLFVGGAITAAGSMSHVRDVLPAGIVVAVISFGVLSLPIAAREMQVRGLRPGSRETMLGNPDARR